jgi:hypothetical protein
LLATMLAPPTDPAPAPGGYWSIAEQRERRGEPPDGEDELTIGSVPFSLGGLRVGAAALTLWLARTPSRCPAEDPGGCQSMATYGWVGLGEGGLMVGTGLTYLIIGAAHRNRHRRWARGESVKLDFGPWTLRAPTPARLAPVGGDVQLRFRF